MTDHLPMRPALALVVGGVVAVAVFQITAIAALIGLYGIPLGAERVEPGLPYFVLSLGGAGLGAGLGGWLTAALGRERALPLVGVLAAALAALALWGFRGPASQWPSWYPGALALIGVSAALAGAVLRRATARANDR